MSFGRKQLSIHEYLLVHLLSEAVHPKLTSTLTDTLIYHSSTYRY